MSTFSTVKKGWRFARKLGKLGRAARLGYTAYKAGKRAYPLAKWAASQVWRLKGLVNSEMHKHEFSANGLTVPITGYVGLLSGVAIGDTYQDRTGNSIYARALNINYTFAWNSTQGGLQQFRMIVFIDTQQIGDTTPAISDVLDSGALNYTVAHMAPATVGRFKILKSFRFHLDDTRPNKTGSINIPMRHHIRFNGSSNADVQKGGIYFLICSNVPTPNYPTLYMQSRLSFHDN